MTDPQSTDTVTLTDGDLSVTVDPAYGCDITSVVFAGTELLGHTPWHQQAAFRRRRGPALAAPGTPEAWLERYQGGWQTLTPHAGPPRTRDGILHGFHGEASTATWHIQDIGPARLVTTVDLVSAPLRIDRETTLADGQLTIRDAIINLSDLAVSFDYVQHPALGAPLIAAGGQIFTGARTIVVPDGNGAILPGRYSWPLVATADGPLDLSVVPGSPRSLYGWLTDFDEYFVGVRNDLLDVEIRIDWSADPEQLEYAWFWQELHGTPDFPWYRRGFLMALEPASTGGSGEDDIRTVLPPSGATQIATQLTCTNAARP